MRLASFVRTTGATWGVEQNGVLHDFGPTGLGVAPSLREAIAGRLLDRLPDTAGAPSAPADRVTFLPVIPDPGKILCVGVNYSSHREETGRAAAEAPAIFIRYADSQMGHLAPAVRPSSTEQFDYEGELAVVISEYAYRVQESEASRYVAGYSTYNDFSVRDWQRQTTQWAPGKNFPNTGAFGPYLALSSQIGDASELTIETRVNGAVRQSASLGDLVFSIPQIIAYVTAFTPLSPGDVILTGTPGGVGLFMEPSGLLSGGDVVEVEIPGVGRLTNTVVQE